MKSYTRLSLYCAAIACAVAVHAQITLQDFSAVVGPNTYFYGSWEATNDNNGTLFPKATFMQGAGVYDINGADVTNSSLSRIEFFFATPLSIGANNFIAVSAQALANNIASGFQVQLIDTAARVAYAPFDAASFLFGSYSLAVVPLQLSNPGFDFNSIDSMIITGGVPGGSDRFNISFDSIVAQSVIPEPSTYAAIFGVLALGLVAYRRRRRSAV